MSPNGPSHLPGGSIPGTPTASCAALRETGSTALTRSIIWFVGRVVATISGRLGKRGPKWPVKILQLVGAFLLAAVTALPVTLVVAVGTVVFWLWNWVSAAVWYVVRERTYSGHVNWPWPVKGVAPKNAPPPPNLLLVLSFESDPWLPDVHRPSAEELACAHELEELLTAKLVPTPAQITEWGRRTGQF